VAHVCGTMYWILGQQWVKANGQRPTRPPRQAAADPVPSELMFGMWWLAATLLTQAGRREQTTHACYQHRRENELSKSSYLAVLSKALSIQATAEHASTTALDTRYISVGSRKREYCENGTTEFAEHVTYRRCHLCNQTRKTC
jgi:hypothetical protein